MYNTARVRHGGGDCGLPSLLIIIITALLQRYIPKQLNRATIKPRFDRFSIGPGWSDWGPEWNSHDQKTSRQGREDIGRDLCHVEQLSPLGKAPRILASPASPCSAMEQPNLIHLSASQLVRQVCTTAEKQATADGVSFKYWYAASDASFEMMLRAGILLNEDHKPISPGIGSLGTKVHGISPDFADRCEMFLLEFLIKTLGAVCCGTSGRTATKRSCRRMKFCWTSLTHSPDVYRWLGRASGLRRSVWVKPVWVPSQQTQAFRLAAYRRRTVVVCRIAPKEFQFLCRHYRLGVIGVGRQGLAGTFPRLLKRRKKIVPYG